MQMKRMTPRSWGTTHIYKGLYFSNLSSNVHVQDPAPSFSQCRVNCQEPTVQCRASLSLQVPGPTAKEIKFHVFSRDSKDAEIYF